MFSDADAGAGLAATGALATGVGFADGPGFGAGFAAGFCSGFAAGLAAAGFGAGLAGAFAAGFGAGLAAGFTGGLEAIFPWASNDSETLSVFGPEIPVLAIRSSTSRMLPIAPVNGSEATSSLPCLEFSTRRRSRSAARREIIAARAAISR
ncbi:hypothetical protein C1H84_01280 [Glutamicibacter soli]|uniref:Uncharacterized protein n=1 Tax=Glutamicibacter soli TaxID=453836 RepID=A0A365YPS8_9MICC|nr:hypothetical protein C1H84_01280 [Glutamicibacter soli]